MSKPSASTYLSDGAEVFTMEFGARVPKGERLLIQPKAPTNTSGRMLAVLRGTPEVLDALEMRTRTAGGDVVCIMRDDGIAIYAGRGEIDSIDENPAVVENKTTTLERRDDGTVAKSVTMNAREETRHSAQLVWAGRVWSEEIIMLNALPDECRADIDASSVGEPVQGWDATDVAAGQLALLKTPLERAERNSLLAVQYEVAQIMGAQFAHRRTSEATKQARGAKRIPLEARQVNAMTVRHRDAITRKRLIEERGLTVSTKVDASSRTRIIVALDSGTSRGKVAQLELFATEGCEGDIGLLALEEMARNRDQAQARRMLALITILTENRGGIEWNEEGKRWLRLQAMALIGQPAAKASKAQADLMRAEIERLETEVLLVSPYGRKRSKRNSKSGTERVSILTVTRTSGETGEATRIALNPELAESMMGKGRGVWMPRDAFALPESDGGYAFTLAFTLIMRWQVGAVKGWESFEKTMEAAGMMGAFKQRAETQGVRDARAWLEGLLIQLRPMMGVVEIDWARGRFIFAQRPKWLTFKRSALLLESDSDNVRLGAASDPA